MKKILLLVITMLLLLVVVSGADEVVDPNKVNLQDIEYKQLVIQQNLQTQNFIKTELAKRDEQLQKDIKVYVDENFRVLDERIDGFIKRTAFKLGMVFISGMVLGGSILLLINNQLKRKNAVKKVLKQKGETLILSGQTLNKVEEQVSDEQKTVVVERSVKPKASKGRPKKTVVVEQDSFASKTIKPMGDVQ